MNTIDSEAVLRWFTGKARVDAEEALRQLAASAEHGSWLPRAARFVAAKLTKSNVARKIAQRHGSALERLVDYGNPAKTACWRVVHNLLFGTFAGSAQELDVEPARQVAKDRPELLAVIASFEAFRNDFAAVAALMDRLDVTRPAPVFTNLGVSPTVHATLKHINVEGSLETIRVPEIEKRVVEVDVGGKKMFETVAFVKWPPNTLHNTSRYRWNAQHQQCQACGHAIKDGYNWCPVLIDDAAGTPRSLWVGRDCARKIFGIKVDGDAAYTNRVAA